MGSAEGSVSRLSTKLVHRRSGASMPAARDIEYRSITEHSPMPSKIFLL